MAKPSIPNIEAILRLGINPKTGLPIKMGDVEDYTKEGLKKILRVMDEQVAVTKGVWHYIPCDMSSDDIERMLYYRGTICLFYEPSLDQFMFAGFALDGSLDFQGRYNVIKPIPWNAGGTDDKHRNKAADALISNRKLTVRKEVVEPGTLTYDEIVNSAVILYDYTRQMPQEIIPRQTLNDPLIDMEAEILPYMRTALLNGTGIRGVRVQDPDQALNVLTASNKVRTEATKGNLYVPVVGSTEFQEMTSAGISKPEDYLLSLQGIDNLRLSTFGVDNGGLFEKKAHMLEKEMAINGGPIGLVMQNYTNLRQRFCRIVNSVFGTNMWYEPSECITGADLNGDGLMYDRQDNTQATDTGEATEGGQENE